MNKIKIVFLLFLMVGCSNSTNNTPEESHPMPEVEHHYYNIGDEIEAGSFNYIVNNIKYDDTIPKKDGTRWLVFDITFKDTLGNEDGYTSYASMYGEFILIDDEKYIYKSYNKEQKTEFYGTTRDVILFNVPVSKREFIFTEGDYFLDDWTDFDLASRNIININI